MIRQSLAMLQDLGPRATVMLARLEKYVTHLEDADFRAMLHGAGVFFARGAGKLPRMAEHSERAYQIGMDSNDTYTRGFGRFMGTWTRLTEPDTLALLDETENLDWHTNNASRDAIRLFRGYVLANLGKWPEVRTLLQPVVDRVFAEAPEEMTYASSTTVGLWGLASVLEEPEAALVAMEAKERGYEVLETTTYLMRAVGAGSANDQAKVLKYCNIVRARQRQANFPYASEVLLPCILLAHRQGDADRAREWLRYALPITGTTNLLPLAAVRVASLYPDVEAVEASAAERNAKADEAIEWVAELCANRAEAD